MEDKSTNEKVGIFIIVFLLSLIVIITLRILHEFYFQVQDLLDYL